eukprot:TRINITY_DN579_c0_g4_i2.p1 TRINITY_DN579_c0_g4~~TRINITY_DN579_c0_g4_i2.p1  ORF type:complete len:974 (-),score=323.13 TRINITY_DN579_c0_g4_i2:134-3055(-)
MESDVVSGASSLAMMTNNDNNNSSSSSSGGDANGTSRASEVKDKSNKMASSDDDKSDDDGDTDSEIIIPRPRQSTRSTTEDESDGDTASRRGSDYDSDASARSSRANTSTSEDDESESESERGFRRSRRRRSSDRQSSDAESDAEKEGGAQMKKTRNKKKKKLKRVPWYMMEEIIRAQQEQQRIKNEALEAQKKLEEHNAWFASLTQKQREEYEVKKSSEQQKKFWREQHTKVKEVEERAARIKEERERIQQRRRYEREQRIELAKQGQLLEYDNKLLIQKCKTCGLKAYKHEQTIVGNDVFHKIGCFKCYYCLEPLKLWNYNVLDGNYYCTAHYNQFVSKINARKLFESTKRAMDREIEKERQVKEEEERFQKAIEEEARRKELSISKEQEELKQKQAELERQAEEMRKFIAQQESGSNESPTSERPTSQAEAVKEPSSSATTTTAAATKAEKRKTILKKKENEDEYEYIEVEVEEEYEEDEEEVDEEEYELVEVLESDGEEVKPKLDASVEALFEAITQGDEKKVEEMLSKISPNVVNADDESALHIAVKARKVGIVKLLLSKNADLLKRTKKNGSTPLHWICSFPLEKDENGKLMAETNDEEEIVRLLVEHPSSIVDITDANLNTPLILAASTGRQKTARILLKAKANVKNRNNHGESCLHAAAYSGREAVMLEIINNGGSDINVRDDQGFTPLHFAIQGNHDKMVVLLLGLGANVHLKDKFRNRSSVSESKYGGSTIIRQLMDSIEMTQEKKKDQRNTRTFRKFAVGSAPQIMPAVDHLEHKQVTASPPEKKSGFFRSAVWASDDSQAQSPKSSPFLRSISQFVNPKAVPSSPPQAPHQPARSPPSNTPPPANLDDTPPPSDADATKTGFLTKKGAVIKNWKRRWFVIEYDKLSYYKSKAEKIPQGSVLFKEVLSVGQCSQEQLRKEGDGRLQNVLSLVTRSRVFFFQADTPEEMNEWIRVLNKIILKI